MKTSYISLAVIATILNFSPLKAEVQAQEVIRVADSFPPNFYIPRFVTKPWMEEVESKANGKIKFEYYPAEQIGKAKDLLSLAQSRVTDVAFVGSGYVSDKMLLASVAEMPTDFSESCRAAKAYLAVVDEVLQEKEFSPQGMKFLFTLIVPAYQIWTASKPLSDADSIKGLKLRTGSGPMELMAQKLGGIPVPIQAPDTYDALSRGTIDGIIFNVEALLGRDLQQISKFGSKGLNFGGFGVNYMMNEARWNELPTDVQKVLEEAGRNVTLSGCRSMDQERSQLYEKARAAGVNLVEFDDASKARIIEAGKEVGDEWARKTDAKGVDGSGVLKLFREKLSIAE